MAHIPYGYKIERGKAVIVPEEAERIIRDTYDGYVKEKYVKDYLVISVWKTDDFNSKNH